jgi:ribonuclease HII
MLAPLIKAQALAWAIAEASEDEIDKHNILQATRCWPCGARWKR